jgi:hypothetical protein
MSNINLEIELGQDKTLTTSPIKIEAKNSRTLGRFHNRIDVNQKIYLQNRPSSNIFSVRLINNLTNLVSTEDVEYIIQLTFEKID